MNQTPTTLELFFSNLPDYSFGVYEEPTNNQQIEQMILDVFDNTDEIHKLESPVALNEYEFTDIQPLKKVKLEDQSDFSNMQPLKITKQEPYKQNQRTRSSIYWQQMFENEKKTGEQMKREAEKLERVAKMYSAVVHEEQLRQALDIDDEFLSKIQNLKLCNEIPGDLTQIKTPLLLMHPKELTIVILKKYKDIQPSMIMEILRKR